MRLFRSPICWVLLSFFIIAMEHGVQGLVQGHRRFFARFPSLSYESWSLVESDVRVL